MIAHVLLLAAALAAGNEKEADEALHRFKANYRNPSAPARAAAVSELARVQHEKVLKQLAMLLTSDVSLVRQAAAKGLGGFSEHKRLAGALLRAAIGPNSKEPDVVAAIFEALGNLDDPEAIPLLRDHFDDRDPKIAKAALAAVGTMRDAASVEPIIERMKKCEKVMASDAKVDKDNRDQAKEIVGVCIKALQAITKERWTTSKEWEIWWGRNKATFKVDPEEKDTPKEDKKK
ncbi:MAG TPA: HEAT repeat domain-containing protein [Planctomycetota bacterium]|jgi:HEAT repeat protein|nr:HEAT repeat domain-containing protein [Planctomycetota bacterium]